MKIIKNYLYSLSYQLLSIFIPFITIPYISRVLGAELVGVNSYTATLVNYFVLVANLGVTIYGNRTIAYFRDSENERSQKFWEITILKGLFTLVMFIAFLIFLHFYPHYHFILLLQSFHLLAVGLDISWFFNGLELFKQTAVRNFVVKLVSVVLIFLFVKTQADFPAYVFIVSFSVFLGNATLWSYLKTYIRKPMWRHLKIFSHLAPIWGLFVLQIISMIFVSLNRLLLGTLSPIAQSGYFDNADKIIRILLSLVTSIGTVIFPRVANEFKNNNTTRVKELLYLTFNAVNALTLPMIIGLISISRDFSNLFFGSSFKGIELVLSILAVELLFMGYSSVLGGQYLIATKQSTVLTKSTIWGTVAMGGLSVLFIPKFGAVGAAVAAVVGEFVIAIVQIRVVCKQLDMVVLFKDFPKYVIATLAMFMTLQLLGQLAVSSSLSIMLKVVLGGLVYLTVLFLLRPQLITGGLKKFAKRY